MIKQKEFNNELVKNLSKVRLCAICIVKDIFKFYEFFFYKIPEGMLLSGYEKYSGNFQCYEMYCIYQPIK